MDVGRIPSHALIMASEKKNQRKMNPDGFNGARMANMTHTPKRPAYFHCLSSSIYTNLLGRQDKGMSGVLLEIVVPASALR